MWFMCGFCTGCALLSGLAGLYPAMCIFTIVTCICGVIASKANTPFDES